MTRRFVLLDANVLCAYYLPESTKSERVKKRVVQLLDAARENKDIVLYVPNVCVAETFSIFAKYRHGSWNRHVSEIVSKKKYREAVKGLREDIHNAKFLRHIEVDRYHVLGADIVASIDHHYKISRERDGSSRTPFPVGTIDHLIVSIGIQLTHIHGPDVVAIVSNDKRMCKINDLGRNKMTRKLARSLSILNTVDELDVEFSRKSFAKSLLLRSVTNADLGDFFGIWPPRLAD